VWVPMADADLLAAGVQEWVHLPLWLAAETARTAWDVDTTRARELGLPSRPLQASVADTWAWMQHSERPEPPSGRSLPGLPAELEDQLLAG
jgi:2'-hydroxyisoflavone reductase